MNRQKPHIRRVKLRTGADSGKWVWGVFRTPKSPTPYRLCNCLWALAGGKLVDRTHRLSQLAVLEYALAGAVTERGISSGLMHDEDADALDLGIAELEYRIEREKIRLAQSEAIVRIQRTKELRNAGVITTVEYDASVTEVRGRLGLPPLPTPSEDPSPEKNV